MTGLDLAPVLLDTARERAGALGLEIDYVVGDAEQLAFEDASFDKVSSTCGSCRPRPPGRRRELARVTGPGGRIALANWTPTGGLADVQDDGAVPGPPPPTSPFDWGDEERIRELLSDAFDLTVDEHVSTARPCRREYWQLFSTSYGPTTLAESLGDRRGSSTGWVEFFDQLPAQR